MKAKKILRVRLTRPNSFLQIQKLRTTLLTNTLLSIVRQIVYKLLLFLITNLRSMLLRSQTSLISQRRVLHSPLIIDTRRTSSIVLYQILEPQEYLQQENLKFELFSSLIALFRSTIQRQANTQFVLVRVLQSLLAQLGSEPPQGVLLSILFL